jgi:hypothetical protein
MEKTARSKIYSVTAKPILHLCLCEFVSGNNLPRKSKRRSRLVRVRRKDVEIINSLQVLSAEHCIYFHEANGEQEVSRLVAKYTSKRKPVEEAMSELKGRNENETFLHQRNQSAILPKLWTFCQQRQNPRIGPDKRRDPHWSALIDTVMKDMDENKTGESVMERMKRILGDDLQYDF